MLIVDYVEVDAEAQSPGATFAVKFAVEYFSDYTKFVATAGILFLFANLLAIGVIAERFWAFTSRNPRSVLGDDVNKAWMSKFFLYVFDYWSDIMFWLLFLVCGIVFISYKVQMRATTLLPEEGEAAVAVLNPFYVIFGITLVFKTFAVAMKLYN